MRQIGGNVTDGTALSLNVEERDAAFGGSIKFENLWNAEAVLEAVPHFRREPIATGQADAMACLVG
jgi:hypothetical protein